MSRLFTLPTSASTAETTRPISLEASVVLEPHPLMAGEASGLLRSERLRRGLNVAVAAIGLLVALPLILVIAAAVKLTSPGPVFYSQERVGLDRRNPYLPSGNWRRGVDHGGRLFRVYKFRTMVTDSDRWGQVWAMPEDPRVTRVGAILRKYRLDEIPQLWNVLKGDMNIVGPRPEQPEIFKELRGQVERYGVRQRALPGITGWAQINHHYDRTIEDVRKKVRYDLEYLERRSALEDLRIMVQTIPAILEKRGAW